jgi:hypothetical protein
MVKKRVVKHSLMKHRILMTLIAFVFVFFVAYAIQSIYPSPEYEDFCKTDRKIVGDLESCSDNGGEWNPYEKSLAVDGVNGWCDFDFSCREEYEDSRDSYELNVFLLNLFFGILAVVLSLFLTVEVVSTGFMAGGTIMIVYGTLRYWGDLSPVLRTTFLGIALAILVFLGYRRFK